MKNYNLSYLLNGQQKTVYNLTIGSVGTWVRTLLNAGAEITGIIDTDEDN